MLPDFAVFKTDATPISQSDIYCSCIVLSCIIFQYFRHKHYTDFSSTFILTCVLAVRLNPVVCLIQFQCFTKQRDVVFPHTIEEHVILPPAMGFAQ